VVSTEGGVNIEEVAHDTPEKDHDHHGRSGDQYLSASRAPRIEGAASMPIAKADEPAAHSSGICFKHVMSFEI